MALVDSLKERANGVCELCGSTEGLKAYSVSPYEDDSLDHNVLVCSKCHDELQLDDGFDFNYWRCLNDSMWSEESPVKVVAYRMLYALRAEGWPQDLLDMMYLEEEDLKWAKQGLLEDGEVLEKHRDVNGVELASGDSVVLVKDLNVKGGGFTAKRGTHVRNISLDRDNPQYIEGRVNGQHIVILTQYVKKS